MSSSTATSTFLTSENIALLFKIAELERRLAEATRQLSVAPAARPDILGEPIAGQPSLTLLQQTQHEAANLHARLTAAQHATAALISVRDPLECARSERDLVLHDNAALTQRITAMESELQARAEAAEQVAAQASELGQCLRSLASLGLREGGACSGGGSDGGSGSTDGSSTHGSCGLSRAHRDAVQTGKRESKREFPCRAAAGNTVR